MVFGCVFVFICLYIVDELGEIKWDCLVGIFNWYLEFVLIYIGSFFLILVIFLFM